MMFNNNNVLKMVLDERWAGMLIETNDVLIWYNDYNELAFRYDNELVFYFETPFYERLLECNAA
jgi:hypothetical protein